MKDSNKYNRMIAAFFLTLVIYFLFGLLFVVVNAALHLKLPPIVGLGLMFYLSSAGVYYWLRDRDRDKEERNTVERRVVELARKGVPVESSMYPLGNPSGVKSRAPQKGT